MKNHGSKLERADAAWPILRLTKRCILSWVILPEGMDDPHVQVLDRRLRNGYHRKFFRIPREPNICPVVNLFIPFSSMPSFLIKVQGIHIHQKVVQVFRQMEQVLWSWWTDARLQQCGRLPAARTEGQKGFTSLLVTLPAPHNRLQSAVCDSQGVLSTTLSDLLLRCFIEFMGWEPHSEQGPDATPSVRPLSRASTLCVACLLFCFITPRSTLASLLLLPPFGLQF